MNVNQILEALLGTKEAFESALGRIPRGDPGNMLIRFLEGLETHDSLENAERERRFSSVFGRVAPSPSDTVSLAEAGARLTNAVLRNTLTQLLPPEYRSLVFNSQRAARLETSETQASVRNETQFEDDTTLRVSPGSSQEHIPFSDVIVLSIADDPATKRLLEGAHFVPLRCQSLDELDRMVATNQEICAFLVESSFLKSLGSDQQRLLIECLARFSTFVWLRFQDDGLACDNPAVGQIISQVRCRTSQPEVTELSLRESAGLQERELPALAAARTRLSDGEARGLFIPGELSPLELKLLGAAMSQFSKRRRFDPRAELTQVKTKFLQGGQTSARVALVKVNDLRVPVIVKLDQKTLILDEARRFLTFIHKDNPELNPEVHLHGPAALIVFGTIPDPHAEDEQPAPTLEQLLLEYWYNEMRDPINCDDGAILLKGFSDAARRIANLNKQKCFASSFPCKANPYLDSVKDMEGKGFNWGFSPQAICRREEAETLLLTAADAAICHGDAHTRNILIRTEQGFLIDYAYSGPGHPCSDLVRLELSIFLTRFSQFGPEDALAVFQRDFSIDRLSLSDLISRHGDLLRSKTNRLCLKMCVNARDLVAEVLEAHNLDWQHYLALKILTAWQSLQVPSLQQVLARGIISAVGS